MDKSRVKSQAHAIKNQEFGAFRKTSDPPPSNWTISYRLVAPLAIICDALIIVACSVLSDYIYLWFSGGSASNFIQYSGFAAISAALFISIGRAENLYDISRLLNFKSQARQITINWVGIFLFVSAIGFAVKVGPVFSRATVFLFEASAFFMLLMSRIMWRFALADGMAVRRFSGRKIALLAEPEAGGHSDIIGTLARHGLQLNQCYILPTDRSNIEDQKKVVRQAVSSIRGSDVEEIVVSADLGHWSEFSALLSGLRSMPLPINLVPHGSISELFKLHNHSFGDTVTIELQRGPRTLLERLLKRLLDIVIAASVLICILPLLLLTAIAIRLDSPGPILFRQRRCGFNGRQFDIFKFRTMSVLENGNAVVSAARHDNRVTRLGHWLRRTSIDELPQLFNVLEGSMSIVGPRPHAVMHDHQFEKSVGTYAYRHHAKPGITGWAQVNGFRGSIVTSADIEQRTKFDLWYVENWSLSLDLKIMLMTAFEVLRGDNAY